MKLNILAIVVLIFALTSCKSIKPIVVTAPSIESEITELLTFGLPFEQSHTGLLVKELNSGKVIVNHKSDQYYTPASNTKLLTFYTCLNILSDRINGLKFFENEDSLVIWGTGDASFLNPYISENDFISKKLKASKKPIYLSTSNFQDEHYGSGWSWDDYNYGYQTDKHSLPIYGNLVHFKKTSKNGELEVNPPIFKLMTIPNIDLQKSIIMRDEHKNLFYFDYDQLKKSSNVNRFMPYITSNEMQQRLLENHLGKKISLISSQSHIDIAENIQSVEADSLYTLLLQPSDNFVAEQLLLNCGSELFDTLNTAKVIAWSRKNLLAEMPHDYQWVDGSGLSRYNMTTPGNMVYLLEKIHDKIDQERLFRLLPTSGVSGTIKNLYTAETPFIHAKTGSLRNNHSLSGYLIGDSGKVYVFSLMNSNYLVSNKELKQGMDKILRILKEKL